jgi:hypothetical protein
MKNEGCPTVCGLPRVLFTGYWRSGGCGFCLGAEKTRSQPVLVLSQGKMLENAAESPASGTSFVGQIFSYQIASLKGYYN